MKRIDIVNDKPRSPRKSSSHLDALKWLSIWDNSKEYFDGDRDSGYGGYRYDGRWTKVVNTLKTKYKLDKNCTLLDIGCAKGYLITDYNADKDLGSATGVDISLYALLCGKREFPENELFCANTTNLPFERNSFDLAFCKDTLHNFLTKEQIKMAVREIERVSKNSWIRVGAYKTKSQKEMLDKWATLATSYYHVDEWLSLLEESGYTGDYDWFHPFCEI